MRSPSATGTWSGPGRPPGCSAHTGLNGPKGGYLDRMERDRAAAALRSLLGDAAYESAVAAGEGLTSQQTKVLLDDLIG